MKILSGIKKIVKPFVDIPSWMGYKQIAEGGRGIVGNIRSLFVPKTTENTETFEAAMERLKLTEADLAQRQKEFKRLIIIFSLLAIVFLVYTFYLLWVGVVTGGVACFGLTILILSYSFRYHFWLFQIRQRKLGCTLREWLDSGFMGGKK